MILFQILPWIGELHRKLFLFRYFCLSHPLIISVLKVETVDDQVKKPKSQLDIFFFLQKLNSNYAVWDLCLWMKPKVSPCILEESCSVSWPSILVVAVVFSIAFLFFSLNVNRSSSTTILTLISDKVIINKCSYRGSQLIWYQVFLRHSRSSSFKWFLVNQSNSIYFPLSSPENIGITRN